MVYYDQSIAVIDTGEDKTEDRRYDSGILQKEAAHPRVTFARVRQTVEQNGTRRESIPPGEKECPLHATTGNGVIFTRKGKYYAIYKTDVDHDAGSGAAGGRWTVVLCSGGGCGAVWGGRSYQLPRMPHRNYERGLFRNIVS